MTSLIVSVGNKIRTLRKEKGMTLVELGSEVGVTPSLISQLERGGINPSFSTLQLISEALGVRIVDLLDNEEDVTDDSPCVTTEKERKVLTTEGGASFSLLSRHLDLGSEFVLDVYPPGTSTGSKKYTHAGVECGLVLEGALEVEVEDRVYYLKPGESITFRSDTPHQVRNAGEETAKAIWVNSKPYIFSHK